MLLTYGTAAPNPVKSLAGAGLPRIAKTGWMPEPEPNSGTSLVKTEIK